MKVPLSVTSFVRGTKQYLNILRNGQWEVIEPPFLPYVYAREQLKLSRIEERVEKKLLSSLEKTVLWKYSFPTTHDIEKCNNRYLQGKLLENHIVFVERIAIDMPDFYKQFPHEREIKTMFFDVEEITNNGKKTGEIILGCKVGEKVLHFHGKTKNDYICMLNELQKLISEVDIIVGYNLINYDMNVLRSMQNITKIILDTTKVILYDVAESVFSDQTLLGIKDRKMKTVAKHYGWDAVELNTRNLSQYSIEQIIDYNISDLNILERLYNKYFPEYLIQAEKTGLPLSKVLEGWASTIPSIICARGLYKKGIVSDGTNEERHPEWKQKKIQGAVVSSGKQGMFKNILKADFKGMYPSIIITCNLSPDTTNIVRYESYNDKVEIQRTEEDCIYYIPDKNIGKRVVVHVDLHETGCVCKFLQELAEWREEVGRKLKTVLTESERKELKSQHYAIKIMRNVFYGYFIAKFSRFADISSGIVTTGIGRFAITSLIDAIKNKYGNIILEVDTDGVYLVTNENVEDIKNFINNFVAEWSYTQFGKRGELVIEYEFYPSGFFSGMKNYLLLDEKGSLIVKGASLHGSHKPKLWDNAIEEIAYKLLKGEVVNFDIDNYINSASIEDFLMRRTIGKDICEYERMDVSRQLAEQLMNRGYRPKIGEIIEYIKTKNGYYVYDGSKREEMMKVIDKDYYQKMLENILISLGVKNKNDINKKSHYTIYDFEPKKENSFITELCSVCQGKNEESICSNCNGTGFVKKQVVGDNIW